MQKTQRETRKPPSVTTRNSGVSGTAASPCTHPSRGHGGLPQEQSGSPSQTRAGGRPQREGPV